MELRIKIILAASLFLSGCGYPAPEESGPTGKINSGLDVRKTCRETYFESFDKDGGGWLRGRLYPMTIWDGVAYSYSPWFLDPWHAPPGAGYLHLLMWIHTDARRVHQYYPGYPGNKFVAQNQSTDFTDAKLTVRLRGEIDLQGSQMLLLVQADNGEMRANYVLTSQPFHITPQWSEQTITLTAKPGQWLCLGARHDRPDYGCYDIAEVLRDVNVDIIFVLFPLKVVPIEDVAEPHRLRAGVDYHVEQKFLPKGVVMFDWVKIEYAN